MIVTTDVGSVMRKQVELFAWSQKALAVSSVIRLLKWTNVTESGLRLGLCNKYNSLPSEIRKC